MIPPWLHATAVTSLLLGAACAVLIGADVARRPQHMMIMNLVWPITALFGSVLVLALYWIYGRGDDDAPFPISVATGALHCGSGCTLGDIAAEWLAFLVPSVAVLLGYGSLFGDRMFAVWVLDFLFAFAFGIVFQYFSIVPMRGLGPAEGIWAAIKADALSLTAWQVGMYGFMALAMLWAFPAMFGARPDVASAEFWFAMQLAMLCGFATAYPVNWWLIRVGVKERM